MRESDKGALINDCSHHAGKLWYIRFNAVKACRKHNVLDVENTIATICASDGDIPSFCDRVLRCFRYRRRGPDIQFQRFRIAF